MFRRITGSVPRKLLSVAEYSSPSVRDGGSARDEVGCAYLLTQPKPGQPLTHKETCVALSRVIGTLPLAVLKVSPLQSECEHVLVTERDHEEGRPCGGQGADWSTWGGGGTHNVGAFGLEGIGPTHVQVRGVVGLQEADEVKALGLQGERHLLKEARGPETRATRTRNVMNVMGQPQAAAAPT